MKKLVEIMLENHSTRDCFRFHISCDECGSAYANKSIPFSKAGIIPPTESKKIIFDAIYEQEFRDARQSALSEAAENLNYCPICKRLVCNRCFLICDDLDMCRSCAAKLNESGSPVFPDLPHFQADIAVEGEIL